MPPSQYGTPLNPAKLLAFDLGKSLLELDTDAEVHIPKHDANPMLKHGKASSIKSVLAARVALRGADPTPLKLNGFTYGLYTDGTVDYAYGFVTTPDAPRPALGDNAYFICDSTYSHDNGDAVRDRDTWHSGHIIAAQLNGDNNDPLNFFPHHHRSNSAGGIWWRMEMIVNYASSALKGAGLKVKAGALAGKPCQIFIVPKFEYATVDEFVPYGGYYTAEIEESCGDQYMAHFSAGHGYVVPYAQMLVEVKSTKVDVFTAAGVKGVKGYRMVYAWLNDYDKADRVVNPEMFKKR